MDEYANVINCSFNGNNASSGSAIYFDSGSVSKTLTNCILLDNRVNAALNVIKNKNNLTITLSGYDNLLTAIYSPGAVTFNNVTYYGLNDIINIASSSISPSSSSNVAYRQNVTVLVIDGNATEVNETFITDDNGRVVVPIDIEHDSYYISVSHSANTYYNTVEQISAQFTVNITSQESYNKTVNLTAKCIFNLPLPGYLQFVMPNGDKVRANYDNKGNWWAQYKFNSIGVYNVTGSYVGLDNVTFNNGTITILKSPTEINVAKSSLNLIIDDEVSSAASLTPSDAGNLTYTSSNNKVAKVENGTIIAISEGTATITASFPGDDEYATAKNKTITVTVTKYDSKVTISPIDDTVYPTNVTIKYSIENKTDVKVTIDGVSDDKIIMTDDTITVIDPDAGKYTITILTMQTAHIMNQKTQKLSL